MPLAHHVKAESLLQSCKEHRHKKLVERDNQDTHTMAYSSRYVTAEIPKYKLPSKGTDAEAAYQLIHDDLTLDGNPTLNLASFVHTWMPPQADKLVMENISKNLIDQDEYPMTQIIHTRCVSMLAHLWKAPHANKAVGTATTGSSEAIQLGGLAMKKIWQAKMKAAGKDIHNPGPNIVMGANAQVALEKFARYFDVEMRLVPVNAESHYCMDPKRAMEYVDENTIGVYVILGSTYTGHYENVLDMSNLLDEYEAKTGINVPIHVDGASGAFVAPFAHPNLKWNFELPRVVSINTSGHKFGLAYVGVGWIVWRDAAHLPKELVFELHYLGSVEYSFSLNFSRPAAPIIAQYFNFINLGFEGYRKIAINDLKNARLLSRALEKSGYYKVLSDVHKPATTLGSIASASGLDGDNPENFTPGLPVLGFQFSEKVRQENPHLEQKWIQTLLRARGWIVPNYNLPPEIEKEEVLRVVCRENFSEDMIDRLVTDLMEVTEDLLSKDSGAAHLAKLTTKTHHDSHSENQIGGLDEHGIKGATYAKPC